MVNYFLFYEIVSNEPFGLLIYNNSQEVKHLPNIKSAIKRVKVSKAKTIKNTLRKSALKTTIKKCKESIAKSDATVGEVLNKTFKKIDKAASKKLIHKNTAARRKSKLAKALNAAKAAAK
jgi:small subunit ribosomal protein S20